MKLLSGGGGTTGVSLGMNCWDCAMNELAAEITTVLDPSAAMIAMGPEPSAPWGNTAVVLSQSPIATRDFCAVTQP